MKSGTYFIYHGKEYMDSTKSVPKGYKILLSGNKDDLNDGFYCTESENFMKKFGFADIMVMEMCMAFCMFISDMFSISKAKHSAA